MTSWDADDLAEVRHEIECAGWTVVSWGANHHDSAIFAIHRVDTTRDVLLSLLATPADDPVQHHVEVADVAAESPAEVILSRPATFPLPLRVRELW